MTDPQRLLDDPGAPAELRAALGAEVRRASSYDPAALGARVASAVAAGAPLGAGALGHGLWFGPKALVVTAVVSAAVGAGGYALVATRAASPSPSPAVTASSTPALPTPLTPPLTGPEVAPAPAAAAKEDAGTFAPPGGPAPRSPAKRGALSDELRLYERGEAALLEGHLEVAVRELRRYLSEHPRGTLRAEAELALVQALARSGRCDEALVYVTRAAPASHTEALRAATRQCPAAAP